MTGFGGFAPLPIRLGGSATEGLTAVQHARICADLCAAKRTMPFARLTFTKSGSTITVDWYVDTTGNYTASFPVTLTAVGTGITEITFPAAVENEYEVSEPVNIKSAKTAADSATSIKTTYTIVSPNKIRVYSFNGTTNAAADATVTVAVWSPPSRNPRIGDYDGALDKEDTRTEIEPYAWTWYQEYGGMLGSAFSTELTGGVHGAKLALARMECGVARAAEAAPNNALPGTSDAMLGDWVNILKIRLNGDEDKHTIRQRCAAKFKASSGNSRTDVDRAVTELIGGYFVALYRQQGSDLANPPAITYWPGVNPGTSLYSLGGGAWFSERSHLVVEVTKPAGVPDPEWMTLMNVELSRELDTLLPSWATFNWATDLDEGFELDIDDLDFTGLTES